MSDAMKVQPFAVLLRQLLQEYKGCRSIFGIDRSLFYRPTDSSPYATDDLFGEYLATPIGPAAGPHTQLAQNIVCAWLSGGRFIELKTVQIMDELEIPRPCIDMEDEGYNVEWSQELKLDQSAREYVNAWVLIHLLRRLLGFEDATRFGTIFNMSVGYNLEGIQSEPMLRFMDRLADASEEIAAIRTTLNQKFPDYGDIEIPTRITNSVTLSTMHGCPPDEIEKIACYLLEDRGLHTTVKLNPTLLGREAVLRILHDDLGYHEIEIPNAVFEHDLKYERAMEMIRRLQQIATERGLTFGVKLSNTLAMRNHKENLAGEEMYMSGRPLYPLTINLFHRLTEEFDGDLNISYSAGADALNVTTILASGARPVTVASDLLKPGGYSRLLQYLENLENEMRTHGAASLDELAYDRRARLEQAAVAALQDPRYKKEYHPYGLPKVASDLPLFDCITAPCMVECAVCQDVPEYAWLIAKKEYDRALAVILSRNPFPGTTGYICTHLCQTACTRNNYDEPVAIRALKRFAVEKGTATLSAIREDGRKIAIIGAGPSGLSAAAFLALNGLSVTVYEAKDVAGGMLAIAPTFRLPRETVEEDIDRIVALGVKIELDHPITAPPEKLLEEGFDAVYVACGFPNDVQLRIDGIEGEGLFTSLDFLARVARDEEPALGSKVLVVGGGNTAIDAARTANRLTGVPATLIYRRTRAEMPAEAEELSDLLAEGNRLEELVSPVEIIRQDGRVTALKCMRNRLGKPDSGGRRRPLPVEGSEFEIAADAIILAIGQRAEVTFLDGSALSLRKDGAIEVDSKTGLAGGGCVYAGGDAARGPAIVIQACADGRRAAEAICTRFNIPFEQPPSRPATLSAEEIRQVKRVRARRENQQKPQAIPVGERNGFDLVEKTLSEHAARSEADRCMQCSTICDKCVEVCPNRANYTCSIQPVNLLIPQLACRAGELTVVGKETFRIEQTRQIIHVDDLCNECGNCATFCVYQGRPYLEKPRLFLSKDDFLLENENAFYMDGETLHRREQGGWSRLTRENGDLIFENAHVQVRLSSRFDTIEMMLKEPFTGRLSLRPAGEMALIHETLAGSLPFLLPGKRDARPVP